MAQAIGTASSSGNNTVIPAPGAGQQIFVTGYSLSAGSAVNAYFADGAGNTFMAPISVMTSTNEPELEGDLSGSAGGFAASEPSNLAGFSCAPGQALILNLSGAVSVTYTIDYYIR